MRLSDKKITLAVTGSIAAYKAADICRSLVAHGAAVTVLMTKAAGQFIGPATFAGLTNRQPISDIFGPGFAHLEAGNDANLILVAPATANTIAKLAAGIADDIVTTTILAADCPVLVCPAMNEKMWLAKATRRNIETLRQLGYEILGPGFGSLACGDVGWGRLEDASEIEKTVIERIDKTAQLAGKKIIVTAGPTREYLDPVRFLSNPSSGKTGYEIAEEAVRRGADVVLISGPTALTPSKKLKFISVQTAEEMRAAVDDYYDRVDGVVMTAAVADHRFVTVSESKINKSDLSAAVALAPNSDILAGLGRAKKDQVLVGFAAQTESLTDNGRHKLVDKNLDLMVATKVGLNEGFGADAIEAVIVDKESDEPLGVIAKRDLAALVVDRLACLLPH